MPVPAVILPTIQRGAMDCGLCCLQMLADRPYDVVRDAALKVIPKLHDRGMFASELTRIGKRLGLRLSKRLAWSDDDVGVLDVNIGTAGSRHFVVLFQGVVINPSDGLIWDYGTYLTTRKAQPRALYAVEDL